MQNLDPDNGSRTHDDNQLEGMHPFHTPASCLIMGCKSYANGFSCHGLSWAQVQPDHLSWNMLSLQRRDRLTICTHCPLAEVSTFSCASLVTEIGDSTGHYLSAQFIHLNFHYVICEKQFGCADSTLLIHLWKLKPISYCSLSIILLHHTKTACPALTRHVTIAFSANGVNHVAFEQ